jgi:hypothetical protein
VAPATYPPPRLRLPQSPAWQHLPGSFSPSTPWAEPDRLQGTLINDATGLAERVMLRPLGSTVLRQVTFLPASG